jgi:hypothetical protein
MADIAEDLAVLKWRGPDEQRVDSRNDGRKV